MRAAVDPRGGDGGLPNACNWADNTGFTSIFDGTLKGWDGDMRFWRAERDQSPRRAVAGSIRVTRDAGSQQAITAAPISTTATAPNTIGS